jgi:DNA-binding beta-propeller fold protein YncE
MATTSTATKATLFVSNGMTGTTSMRNGTPFAGKCTVARLELALRGGSPPKLTQTTVIGKDFPWVANKPTFILSETGLAPGHNGTLYVDNTETNSVSAITHALTRTKAVTQRSTTITSRGSLNAPLGMTLAPNGDLLVDNGNNGNLVEITPVGKQIATVALVKKGAGDLFGLALQPGDKGILFVNDGANALDLDH